MQTAKLLCEKIILMRQEGRGQGTAIKGMTQRLTPRWQESQLPVGLELHSTRIVIYYHGK